MDKHMLRASMMQQTHCLIKNFNGSIRMDQGKRFDLNSRSEPKLGHTGYCYTCCMRLGHSLGSRSSTSGIQLFDRQPSKSLITHPTIIAEINALSPHPLQHARIVCHRCPTHIEDTTQPGTLHLNALRRFARELHGGQHVHGNTRGTDGMTLGLETA
jgi:hypothetical protein